MQNRSLGMAIFTLLLMLHAIIPVSAYASSGSISNPFKDIESSWAKTNILIAYESGFINGISKDTFAPKAHLTLEQFIKMLIAGFNQQPNDKAPTVQGSMSDWAKPYIAAAVQLNWIDNGEFASYKAVVTREQAAYLLGKAFVSFGHGIDFDRIPSSSYSDQELMNPNYIPYVHLLKQFEVISGVSQDSFDPKGQLTREQGVSLMMRLLAVQLVLSNYIDNLELVSYDYTLKMLQLAYVMHPSSYVLEAAAQILGYAGEWELALQLYEDAARLYGTDYELAVSLSYALFKNGQAERALHTLEQALQGNNPNDMEMLMLSQYAFSMGDQQKYDQLAGSLKSSSSPDARKLAEQLDPFVNSSGSTAGQQATSKPAACSVQASDIDMTLSEFFIKFEGTIMNYLSFLTLSAGLLNPYPLGAILNGASLIANIGYGIYHKTAGDIQESDLSAYSIGIITSAAGVNGSIAGKYALNSPKMLGLAIGGDFSTIVSFGQFTSAAIGYPATEEERSGYANDWAMENYIFNYHYKTNQLDWAKFEYLRSSGDQRDTWCKVIIGLETEGVPTAIFYLHYGMRSLESTPSNYEYVKDIIGRLGNEVMTYADFTEFRKHVRRMEQDLNISEDERISKSFKLKALYSPQE